MIPSTRRLAARLTAGSALAFVVSCASGGASPQTPAGPSAGAAGASAPTRSTASILIADDLRKTDALSLSDAIRRLRPQWLRRGQATAATTTGLSPLPAEPFVVWIDNARAGGAEVLDQIPITKVRSVQYFSPTEAEARFGASYSSGVIQVITTASPNP